MKKPFSNFIIIAFFICSPTLFLACHKSNENNDSSEKSPVLLKADQPEADASTPTQASETASDADDKPASANAVLVKAEPQTDPTNLPDDQEPIVLINEDPYFHSIGMLTRDASGAIQNFSDERLIKTQKAFDDAQKFSGRHIVKNNGSTLTWEKFAERMDTAPFSTAKKQKDITSEIVKSLKAENREIKQCKITQTLRAEDRSEAHLVECTNQNGQIADYYIALASSKDATIRSYNLANNLTIDDPRLILKETLSLLEVHSMEFLDTSSMYVRYLWQTSTSNRYGDIDNYQYNTCVFASPQLLQAQCWPDTSFKRTTRIDDDGIVHVTDTEFSKLSAAVSENGFVTHEIETPQQ